MLQVNSLLNTVIAVVNTFVADMTRRDKIQHALLVESSGGLGLCLAQPLATEVSLLLLIFIAIVSLLAGLPILYLHLQDHCQKYNVKQTSRQLKLRHEAENLRDLRYLSNRAAEEKMERNRFAPLAFNQGYMETPIITPDISLESGAAGLNATISTVGPRTPKKAQALVEEAVVYRNSRAEVVKKARARIEQRKEEEGVARE